MENLPESIKQHDTMDRVISFLIKHHAPMDLFQDAINARGYILMGMSVEDFRLWQEIRGEKARATSTQ